MDAARGAGPIGHEAFVDRGTSSTKQEPTTALARPVRLTAIEETEKQNQYGRLKISKEASQGLGVTLALFGLGFLGGAIAFGASGLTGSVVLAIGFGLAGAGGLALAHNQYKAAKQADQKMDIVWEELKNGRR
ncbi:MAG: hypothetical protein H0X51_07420 [Parachlamydiaceae bacterium]|nr:hypothetical protein [Parachlamydiaceae bacterium]